MPTLKNISKHHNNASVVLINGVDYSQKSVKICLSHVRPRGAYGSKKINDT